MREEVRGVISINLQKMAGTVVSRTLSVGTESVEILSFISPGTVRLCNSSRYIGMLKGNSSILGKRG